MINIYDTQRQFNTSLHRLVLATKKYSKFLRRKITIIMAKQTRGPCPHLCTLVPTNVPGPAAAQPVLHPRKDVFVLKVAKIGPNGDRRCKMELELVTPKYREKKQPYRVDTRETQCEEPCCPCCCTNVRKKKKR